MKAIETIHAGYVQGRRVRRLGELLAQHLPTGSKVLDVGTGDGWLAHLIQAQRPDLEIHGLDVLVRAKTHVPVTPFDGKKMPVADGSYDVVLFVDVLHHTDDPMILLREARRVARRGLVIKDHVVKGVLARSTLRFMDEVGNRRYGVSLPHNYWTEPEWQAAFQTLGMATVTRTDRLALYPWPASLLFDRKLHFIASLAPFTGDGGGPGPYANAARSAC